MNWAANIWGRFAAAHHNSGPVEKDVTPMATVTTFAPKAQATSASVHWFKDCIERGKSGVFSEVTIITPAMASVILGFNPDNRALKAKRELFASDMRNGRWTFNGEPLLFSVDGLLNDGQNRLHAVIDANTPQPFLCVFGLTRESRMSVDQGAARCAGDYLGMSGSKNAHNLAAVTKGVMAFERGDGLRMAPNEITTAEQVERATNDTALMDATDYAVSVYRHTRTFAAPKIIGTAYYLLADVCPLDARIYLDAVCIGEGLKRTDPAFAVREALMSVGKTKLQSKLEIIFRGWVAYRQGRTLKMAKVLGTFPALV